MNKANCCKLLAFDSQLFGVKTALCTINNRIAFDDVKSYLLKHEVDLAYLTSKTPLSTFKIENSLPYSVSYIDEKVLFEKEVEENPILDLNIKIKTNQWVKSEIQQIQSLALTSGQFSRFFLDQRLQKNKAEELYKIWIDKSLNFEIADEIYLSGDKDISGLLTVKFSEDQAQVGLLAVDLKYRGQGIAKKLIIHMENQCKAKGIATISIPTQRINNTACEFYLNSGYSEVESSFIYHCWKSNG